MPSESRKKKTTKKKTAASRNTAGRSATSKKASTRKTGVKKKAGSRKSTTKKKTGAKKTAARAAGGSKRKKTAKKTSKKQSAAKKTSAKKSSKKTAARAASKKKTVGKKAAAPKKKSTAKKSAAKKSGTKKSGTKTSGAKKSAAKKASTKKSTAKKAAEKKTSKKSTTKKKKAGEARAAAGENEDNGHSRKSTRSVASVASHTDADEDGYVVINGRRVRMVSTKGYERKKKTKPANDATETAEKEVIKPVKTPLTAKELRHFRNLLMIKRAELVGDLGAMEAEALRSGSGDVSHMPIHMADMGTDTYDQDFMLNLAENERQRLREIDDALRRIENKSYGVCQMTAKPIPKSRLEAKPWAKYTIEAAERVEQGYHTL